MFAGICMEAAFIVSWLDAAKSAEPDTLSWAEYEAERQFPCGWDERDAKV